MKTSYNYTFLGKDYKIALNFSNYQNNDSLALNMLEEDGTPFATITVNLAESSFLGDDMQFVDENNLPGIGKWLEKNNIAKYAGIHCRSGYCTYPLYKFNTKLL